jgi:hypothetical protein
MDFEKLRRRKPEKVVGSRTTYEQAAMSIALNLSEFCDENYFYPDMVMEAARQAAREINRLRDLQPPGWMIIDAFRYALGRSSYQVSATTAWLVEHWAEIPLGTQEIIDRELEKAFAIDDEDWAHGNTWSSRLGHACDRASWETVRDLWRKN